jgi:hypothetical protein
MHCGSPSEQIWFTRLDDGRRQTLGRKRSCEATLPQFVRQCLC